MPPLFLPCCLIDIDGWTMNDDEKNICLRTYIPEADLK